LLLGFSSTQRHFSKPFGSTLRKVLQGDRVKTVGPIGHNTQGGR